MYAILILFFLSLIGITVMIGRKLILLRKGQLVAHEHFEFEFEIPKIQEIRYIVIRHTKKHGYLILVATIRFYLKSSATVKEIYKKGKNKADKLFKKYILRKHKEEENKIREVSGFLKMISEYKQKIKKIKHRIKEEENLK